MFDTNFFDIKTLEDYGNKLKSETKDKIKFDEKVKAIKEAKDKEQIQKSLDELFGSVVKFIEEGSIDSDEKKLLEGLKKETQNLIDLFKKDLFDLQSEIGVKTIDKNVISNGFENTQESNNDGWTGKIRKGWKDFLSFVDKFFVKIMIWLGYKPSVDAKKVGGFFEKIGFGDSSDVASVIKYISKEKYSDYKNLYKQNQSSGNFLQKTFDWLKEKAGFKLDDKQNEILKKLIEFISLNQSFIEKSIKKNKDEATLGDVFGVLFGNIASDYFRDYSIPVEGVKYKDYKNGKNLSISDKKENLADKIYPRDFELSKGNDIDFKYNGKNYKLTLSNEGKLQVGFGNKKYILDKIKTTSMLFFTKEIANIDKISLVNGETVIVMAGGKYEFATNFLFESLDNLDKQNLSFKVGYVDLEFKNI